MSASPQRIVVVGGGVIGLTVAWSCATHADSGNDTAGEPVQITVIDPDPGGTTGASWVAGGMLAPVAEAHQTEPDLVELCLASSAAWPAFASRLEAASGGLDVGLSAQGTLVVARDADDVAELAVLQAVQERFACAVTRLSSSEARRFEPALSPTVRGALWLETDHQVDNRMLLRALLAACERDPRIALVRARATAVRPGAVHVADGGAADATRSIAADAIVVCTGAWPVPISLTNEPTAGADGSDGNDATDGAGVRLPIRPVKGQIVRLQGVATAVMPTHTVRGLEVYVIPRPHGEIAVGATSEELGFDTRVTAGGVRDLLDRAWEVLPGLAEATFVEATAGLRPGTPDNAPLLGAIGPPGSGLFVAGGHYRNGVLLAPVTGALLAPLVRDGVRHPLLAAFAPHRFPAFPCGSDAPIHRPPAVEPGTTGELAETVEAVEAGTVETLEAVAP